MEETFLYKGEIVTSASFGYLLLMNKKKCVISTEGRKWGPIHGMGSEAQRRNPVLVKARSLAKARDDKEIVWSLIE